MASLQQMQAHDSKEGQAQRSAPPVAPSPLNNGPLSDHTSSHSSHDAPARDSPIEDASPQMSLLQKTETGRSMSRIPLASLDPEGTAKLSHKLSKNSAKTLSHVDDSNLEEGRLTPDPFDKEGHFDLEAFLRQLLGRGKSRGLETREMGLVWRDLTVTGIGAGVALNESVGSLLMGPFNALQNIQSLRHPSIKTILDNFEGCVKPGEMLLVLGRPGAGCTSFLKTMASYRDGFRSIEGTLLYEGMDHKVIDGQLRGDVVYCPEDDIHFPTMTVNQTLSFAAATRAPQARRRALLFDPDGKEASRSSYIKTTVEVLATILGLRHTYNTKVGNDMIRGVSGGERKRVSVAETLASRAKVVLFDNSSRGLDSSTALEFVKSLRIATDVSNITTIASIYQAGEGLTQLFDKVLVINEGQQVYFGPTSEAAEYFHEMGFQRYNRQTTADFLVACTDVNGREVREGYEARAPRTAEEMAHYWRESKQGQANRREVEEYLAQQKATHTAETVKHYKAVAREDKAKHTRNGSAYILSLPMQVRLAIKRRAQITWGDLATQLIMVFASVFQALITGSVFYQMPNDTSGFFSRGGVLFFALLYQSFTAMSEITTGYAQRPIIIRQRRFAMIHPAADAVANTLLDFPIRIITLTLFDVLIYFMTGLATSADQFFVFWGFTTLVSFTMVAFFRMLAAVCRAESTATMLGGLAVIDMALYAGYVIPRPSMVKWWKWLSYCNPVSFGFEVLLTNEFRRLNVPCSNFLPSGSRYNNVSAANKVCPIASAAPGQEIIVGSEYLEASFGYTWAHTGRNAGIIIGFWIFFLIVYVFATEVQKDPSAAGGVMVFKRGRAPKGVIEAAKTGGDREDAEKQGHAGTNPTTALATPDALDEQAQAEAAKQLDSSDSIFSWRDVNYDVEIKGETRRLLNNVSGFVAPGKMTALMGESGAGKTTLLNVLAQRTDTGVVQGLFQVDGHPLPRSFQAATGYCQQQDVHLESQTVREALQFSALLRQPREVPREEKLAYVENVIQLLEMESWAEAMVGNVGEGLNVEQRKRLTIGVELAAKPKLLLFLDEPTSGLDAMAAWSIVRFLRKLADAGQAILCTIHQPSGELFNQFDRLLLLQKGGKTVYFGDIGRNSEKLLTYFGTRSGKQCGEDENPAEYILDVIGAGATATSKTDWHQQFLESELKQELNRDLDRIESASRQADVKRTELDEISANREFAQPLSTQAQLVLWRNFVHYWRTPVYVMSKVMLNVVAGLFIGSSFWNQGSLESKASLQNKIFAMFMALVLSTSLSQQLQPMFIMFRGLFEVRERPSKMYSWWVAVGSALLVEVPWNLLGGTLFWVSWYWMAGFPSDTKTSVTVWGYYMLFQIYYQTFAAAIAALSANAMVASVLFSTLFSFVIVFCGVVQPPASLPYFWRSWMFPLSPFTYLIEGMLGLVLGGKPVRCSASEFNTIIPPAGQSCAAYLSDFTTDLSGPDNGKGYFEQAQDGTCRYCMYRYGDDYLRNLTFDADHIYRNIGIIIAFIAFNVFLGFGMFYAFRVWKPKGKQAKKTAAQQQQQPAQQQHEVKREEQ
ncbi:ATP-binding cassette transporter snq2 [Thecaphora frezii]